MLREYDDFRSIVLNNTPLIDVRAPVEFKKGAFLNAVNLPIMDDDERHRVGTCYKNSGNEKAVELGHLLVSGEVRERRIAAWIDFMDANPNALLYCFRGGQRSRISQRWLQEQGREIVRLRGGYKAFRNFLIQSLDTAHEHFKPIILGGRTGCGKTLQLKEIQNSIDLEALANHRGSSFGRKIAPQTSQINFENNLAYAMIQKIEKGACYLVFEDEGKHIGNVFMPESFISAISKAMILILETPMDERVEITLREYVIEAQNIYGKEGFLQWQESIKNSMKKIEKRLGNEKYRVVFSLFEEALNEQMKSGSYEKYKDWIEYLLREYYDPMYDYQIEKRSQRVLFRGNASEIKEYIENLK